LDYLKEKFYADGTECPKCAKASKFHRIKGRSAYSCQFCGHHVYPTAGTIFHKSTTSLQLWFWAIYLISSSKCGISAKQLGREIGVTYKTAWRMMKQIRLLLNEDTEPLSGDVEVDETFIGGKLRNSDRRRAVREGKHPSDPTIKPRQIVMAAVQRQGGVRATVVPDRT
jgi:transposase-like protein